MNNLNFTHVLYLQSLFFPLYQSRILTHLFLNLAEDTYPYLQDPNPIIILVHLAETFYHLLMSATTKIQKFKLTASKTLVNHINNPFRVYSAIKHISFCLTA